MFRHTTLHFRGETGLWLKTRAAWHCQLPYRQFTSLAPLIMGCSTFLEHRSLVNLCDAANILVFLVHVGRSVALFESCPLVV
jgi:hypothetical protein